MPRLVTALLAKNEGAPDRYLKRVLENALSFSDTVLLLDDASTDNTRDIALEMGVQVSVRPSGQAAWGAEKSAREELWGWLTKEAGDGWGLIMDADMLLVGDPRPYCNSWEVSAWAWGLWDLWDSEQTARIDGPWQLGPQLPRPWMFRMAAGKDTKLGFGPPDAMGRKAWTPAFQDRGIHVGHMPSNWPGPIGVADTLAWKHLAYLMPDHRKAKFEAYMRVKDQLSPFEYQHALSVADK